MTTLNISLPSDLKKAVDERVAKGGFASHSEYLRSLIREDQKRLAQEEVEAKLLARLQSDSTPMSHSDFENIRKRLKTHLARRRKSKR
jgi:antitoxin ParD1/3/4